MHFSGPVLLPHHNIYLIYRW